MKPKLSKALLAAVLATFAAVGSTVGAADSISINFYSQTPTITSETSGSLNGISGSQWNNINCQERGSGTYAVNNQSGVEAGQLVLSYSPLSAWGAGVGSELEDVLAHSYLDLTGSNHYTVSLDSYLVQDVILYFSGDGGVFNSVNVNGTSYVGGVDQQGSGTWGSRASWTDNDHYYDASGNLNANKAIQVSRVLGAVTVTNNSTNDTNERATLAGMQIIDRTNEVVYATTLGSGSTAATEATWTRNGETAAYGDIAQADRMLLVTADANGSTMTLEGEDSINMLAVKENALTVTSDGAVTVGALHTYQGATLNFNAGLQSDSSVNVSGKGTVNLNGSLNNVSLTNAGTLHITSANSSIANLTNTGTLNIDGTNTIGSLTNSAGTLNINADTTVSGAFSNAGSLTVAQGKKLTLNGSSTQEVTDNPTFATLFAHAGEGNITINGDVKFHKSGSGATYEQQATKVLVNGNLEANSAADTKWIVGSGKTLQSTGDMAFKNHQTLTVGSGTETENYGTVIVGGQLIIGHETPGNYPGHLVLKEGGQLTAKSLYLRRGNGNNTMVMTGGTLEFTGDAASVITRDNANSSVSITGGTLKASKNSWTADLGEGGSAMAVSNVTIETTGDYSIALGHVNLTGAITNNGNLALTDANIADGTTITNNGNLTLGTVTNNGMASLNGNITLSGTITDNGSFNLANAQVNILSLDGFTRDESAAATYTGGQVEGNGFEQSTYIVITGSGTENKSLEVSYDGRTQNLQDGKLMGQTYGTFHVNSDTESVFYIASAAPEGHDTSTISMAGGTTLTVDAALGGRDIAVNGAATADIQSGQSLSASSVNVSAEGSSLTLTGNGSYYAGQDSSRNVYLHAAGREKVALGADWTGEVIVEGMTNTNYLDLNNLGHQGSTVTLKGSTGYLKQANNGNVARFTADLQLVNADNGTAAYTVINGNSGSGGTDPGNHYIFEGAVKGTGDFVYDHSLGSETIRNRQTFEFAGDVSEWTGKLENLEGLSTFRFKEDATEVNINTIQVRTNGANNKMDLEFAHDRAATVNSVIQKAEDAGSSEIHLAVQNTSAEGTTFTKSVSADTLTVGDNTKASFNGATSAGTLETGAGSTLSGTVTVASTATINGSVENGGLQWAAGQSAQTFNLNTVYDVGNANVLTTIATGSTINFGETGMIELGTAGQDNTGLAGKSLTLTASFTLNEAVEGSILSTETLWLIKGTGIDASLVNFDASTATESGSSALTRYAWATSLEAEWVLPESTAELMRAATEPEAGAYRFVATDEGIGVQYYQNNVPEPTTATLSLLALAALAARRRR